MKFKSLQRLGCAREIWNKYIFSTISIGRSVNFILVVSNSSVHFGIVISVAIVVSGSEVDVFIADRHECQHGHVEQHEEGEQQKFVALEIVHIRHLFPRLYSLFSLSHNIGKPTCLVFTPDKTAATTKSIRFPMAVVKRYNA